MKVQITRPQIIKFLRGQGIDVPPNAQLIYRISSDMTLEIEDDDPIEVSWQDAPRMGFGEN